MDRLADSIEVRPITHTFKSTSLRKYARTDGFPERHHDVRFGRGEAQNERVRGVDADTWSQGKE